MRIQDNTKQPTTGDNKTWIPTGCPPRVESDLRIQPSAHYRSLALGQVWEDFYILLKQVTSQANTRNAHMNKPKFISALALFNAAIFLLATLFLPSSGSFSYGNPISYYINSRTDWHVAFGVLIAGLLISWGVYLVLISFRDPKKGGE